MPTINLKPEHKAVNEYYAQLNKLTRDLNAKTEGAVAPLFANLLRHCASQAKLTLIEQFSIKRPTQTIRVDGAIVDEFKLAHGIWEAKDSADDLAAEIKKKVEKGYPKDNILFQAPRRAVLYQDGNVVMDADLNDPEELIEVLKLFFEYEPPAYDQWTQAVEEFKLKVPELGEGLLELIEEQRKGNKAFVSAFEDFTRVVQEAINPNISTKAVEEMLIQHILTERLFRKIFNNPDFATRNVIAVELEKVVKALTSRSFSRSEFLRSLDRFYGAIETTAATIDDYSQKQAFLNIVYEKFFQGFSVKAADIYGIVYTPQPIVNFMVNSVEHILKEEFGRSLGDEDVHIIDPFVGTGNFITNIMRHMPKTKLPYKYANELHCNEVMLLPYYIASMNIEHEYLELTGDYKPYEGICLVDTFEVTEQMTIFGHENTQRIAKQRNAPIFVVIANPPYNAGQVNENDNNKNRKYAILDKKIADTYSRYSKSQLRYRLNDPYVKAIKWASDRIGNEGIVALVNNNSYINEITFDGMRKCISQDFDSVFILDLGGNVRKNPKLSGTTHNVFGIQVGVSINFFIKLGKSNNAEAKIFYARLNEYDTKEKKYEFLDSKIHYKNVTWEKIKPDKKYNWLDTKDQEKYSSFITIAKKEEKSSNKESKSVIFKIYSLGIATNRDSYVYNFSKKSITHNVQNFIDIYKNSLNRLMENPHNKNVINVEEKRIKWTRQTKKSLFNQENTNFLEKWIVKSQYRPFCSQYLYYDDFWNEEQYQNKRIFPLITDKQNQIICFPTIGSSTISTFISEKVVDLNFFAGSSPVQCYPFFTYDEDGSKCTENITDWALEEFRKQYKDDSISKWDIFYYVYGYLHHPGYREKYAVNLRRELPRIPFAPDFWAFSKAGKRLAELHVKYEEQEEYPLSEIENPDSPLDWKVVKMKLSPDKSAVIYNDFLTLAGIPAEIYEYKLGNRSALEWVIDQYRVKTDKRSGIVNDPNDAERPDYIVKLLKKIVTVSLETVKIVRGLPEEFE